MRRRQLVTPVTLREVYQLPGEYSAKLVIDPRESPKIDDVAVEIRNSDGKPMEYAAKRWGTKLTVSFVIDESTPDGVSIIDITMSGKDRPVVRERLSLWVIK